MTRSRKAIEIRHLRYVVAAAEHGSFRRAADVIGVQVSSVSRGIRDLEDDIGATLFIRFRNGVRLTRAGELFVRRAQVAISQIASAERDVGAIGRGEDGLVVIGILSSLAAGFLASLLEAYASSHATVRTKFVEGSPTDHIRNIQHHHMDVAFLTGSPSADGCESVQLWIERVYVAMPRGDLLASKRRIKWNDLRNRRFIVSEAWPGHGAHAFLVKHLSGRGFRAEIEFQAVHHDTLMPIVASGRGLALASEAMVAARFPGVVYRPLDGETLSFSAIWSSTNDNPAFRRLLSLARQLANKPAGLKV